MLTQGLHHEHLCCCEAQTFNITLFLVLTSLQAGLMDVEGHLVGEPDGQSFGLGVAPFPVKPGKKAKTKKKDQFR